MLSLKRTLAPGTEGCSRYSALQVAHVQAAESCRIWSPYSWLRGVSPRGAAAGAWIPAHFDNAVAMESRQRRPGHPVHDGLQAEREAVRTLPGPGVDVAGGVTPEERVGPRRPLPLRGLLGVDLEPLRPLCLPLERVRGRAAQWTVEGAAGRRRFVAAGGVARRVRTEALDVQVLDV